MDRRSFLTGLLGAAGVAALATTIPRDAEAALTDAPDDLFPRSDALPPEAEAEIEEDEGVEVAQRGDEWRRRRRRRGRRRYRRRYRRRHRRWHRRYYRRRRVRRRRWRRRCRWYWNRWGRRVRSCRRYPYWIWLWI